MRNTMSKTPGAVGVTVARSQVRHSVVKSSIAASATNAFKRICASAVLALPYCAFRVGNTLSTVMLVVCALMSSLTWVLWGASAHNTLLAKCYSKQQEDNEAGRVAAVTDDDIADTDVGVTANEVALTAFGRRMAAFVDVSIVCMAFMTGCNYLVVASDAIGDIWHGLAGTPPEYWMRLVLIVALVALVLFPLSCKETLHSLRWTSALGSLAVGFACVFVVAGGIVESSAPAVVTESQATPQETHLLWHIFNAIAIINGAYDAHTEYYVLWAS
ncbi:MAG: hypothetical protein MHM6MM_004064 [Cercozoa sp. M6MM]